MALSLWLCCQACQPLQVEGSSLVSVQPGTCSAPQEWEPPPKEGGGPRGKRQRANEWFKSQFYLTLGLKTKGELLL